MPLEGSEKNHVNYLQHVIFCREAVYHICASESIYQGFHNDGMGWEVFIDVVLRCYSGCGTKRRGANDWDFNGRVKQIEQFDWSVDTSRDLVARM